MNRVDLRFCGMVTAASADPGATARDLVAAGCTALIYRAGGSFRESLAELGAMLAALDGSEACLLVEERVDLAAVAGSAGILLRRQDIEPRDARSLLGPRAVIAMTVWDVVHADELFRLPVDGAVIGGDDPDLERIGRLAFRAHLAAPGIKVIAEASHPTLAVEPLIGAGIDGIARPATLILKAAERGADRAAIDAALAGRDR